jgi:signal transduction histidine kinase
MLSSITRHDILNVLTALTGYLEFAATETSIEETRHFIQKAQVAARSIRHHIEFTRDYQDLGSKEPIWHDIASIVKNSAALINAKEVAIIYDPDPRLFVLADPLLLKVIYNLMENAIRHGGRVRKITSAWKKDSAGNVRWCIEDDGIGIPASMKKQIFAREVGKNTGLGLFLAREILAITGICIEENGVEGKGARFMMTIPEGKYRIE